MSCPRNSPYLGKSLTSDGLRALGQEAFSDISASFSCAVNYGMATNDLIDIRHNISTKTTDYLFFKNPAGKGRFIDGNTRLYILNDVEWQANTRITMGPAYAGTYFYEPGAVLLHASGTPGISWCRNTLIHETLHSVSLYSRIFRILRE